MSLRGADVHSLGVLSVDIRWCVCCDYWFSGGGLSVRACIPLHFLRCVLHACELGLQLEIVLDIMSKTIRNS